MRPSLRATRSHADIARVGYCRHPPGRDDQRHPDVPHRRPVRHHGHADRRCEAGQPARRRGAVATNQAGRDRGLHRHRCRRHARNIAGDELYRECRRHGRRWTHRPNRHRGGGSFRSVPVLRAAGSVDSTPRDGAAILYVACLMARALADIDWPETTESAPAVVTAMAIPLTFSIADGIGSVSSPTSRSRFSRAISATARPR